MVNFLKSPSGHLLIGIIVGAIITCISCVLSSRGLRTAAKKLWDLSIMKLMPSQPSQPLPIILNLSYTRISVLILEPTPYGIETLKHVFYLNSADISSYKYMYSGQIVTSFDIPTVISVLSTALNL